MMGEQNLCPQHPTTSQVAKLRMASKSAVRYDRELQAIAVKLPSTQVCA